MNWVHVLFSFEGRVRRTTFWLAHIGFALATTAIAVVLIALAGGLSVASQHGGSDGAPLIAALATIWLLPLYAVGLWVGLALGVKRCHDRGYPGVMMLITLIPVLGALWALIDLGFIDGTPGPNKYGPSPKALASTPEAAVA